MWVVEYSHPYDSETIIFLFDQEEDAYKYAVDQMMNTIRDSWDWSDDDDLRDEAKSINDHVKAGEWKDALSEWHDSSENQDEHACYWHVYERFAKTWNATPFTFADDAFEEEEGEEEETSPPTQPSAVVNDYTCPCCQNDKCSTTEKSCWKCGSPIQP